jgi:hypothetical protein
LKDQGLEHRHRIKGRTPSFEAVTIPETLNQPTPEKLEVDRRCENLERIAMLAQLLEMLRKAEKAALFHETDSLIHVPAIESEAGLKREGFLRVSSLARMAETWCPAVLTEMNSAFWKTPGGQKLIERIPQRRIGQPEHLDGALLLLASDAGEFMTGSVITVDGGHTVSSL